MTNPKGRSTGKSPASPGRSIKIRLSDVQGAMAAAMQNQGIAGSQQQTAAAKTGTGSAPHAPASQAAVIKAVETLGISIDTRLNALESGQKELVKSQHTLEQAMTALAQNQAMLMASHRDLASVIVDNQASLRDLKDVVMDNHEDLHRKLNLILIRFGFEDAGGNS